MEDTITAGTKYCKLCEKTFKNDDPGMQHCPECGSALRSAEIVNGGMGHGEQKKTKGIPLSFIGSLASIGLAFYLPIGYPFLREYAPTVLFVLMGFMIAGGITSFIGACVSIKNPRVAWKIIMAGGFIAGINILIIMGGGFMKGSIQGK